MIAVLRMSETFNETLCATPLLNECALRCLGISSTLAKKCTTSFDFVVSAKEINLQQGHGQSHHDLPHQVYYPVVLFSLSSSYSLEISWASYRTGSIDQSTRKEVNR